MGRNYEALNYAKHGKLLIKPGVAVDAFKKSNIVPVVLNEFERVASEFPIVFVKNENNDLSPVALLSFTKDNKYISDDGWQSRIVPHALVSQPFALSLDDKSGKYIVALNVEHSLVSESEGVSIFNDDGSESDDMLDRKKHLMMCVQQSNLTEQFTRILVEKKLITERQFSIKKGEETIQLPSFYILDKGAIENLSQKSLIEFKKLGILGKCYALAHSLEQLGKLAESI